MEGDSTAILTLEKDTIVSGSSEKVDEDKVDEHPVEGVLNGDEEIEPPHVGMVFASQEEVRSYYSRYAHHQGFGIMRRTSKYGDDGMLDYFVLACALSGQSRSKSNKWLRFRQLPKTNCKAKINVVMDTEGRFCLSHVVLEHNHELSPGNARRYICDQSGGSGVRKRREVNEQAGTALQQVTQVVVGDSGGLVQNLPTVQDSLRRALVKRAVGLVKSGMVIGLGTGSTLSLIVEELVQLIREGKLKDIVAVGTNYQTRLVARQFGMITVDLNDVNYIDIAFDGVDEVDFNKNLLKCRGAAHTVQKVVDSMAKGCVILAEHTKVVLRLGSNLPVAHQ